MAFLRLKPILHVSISSSSESEDERPMLSHGEPAKEPPFAPSAFSVPDARMTEREWPSDDEEVQQASLRSLLNRATVYALQCNALGFEERFRRLSLDDTGPSADVLHKEFSRIRLTARPARRHRRSYAGKPKSGKLKQETGAERAPDSLTDSHDCLTCPHCGHIFTFVRSLTLHRKVCKPSHRH